MLKELMPAKEMETMPGEGMETLEAICVPLRGMTILPGAITHFDVMRPKSVMAIERAMANNERIFVVSQMDIAVIEPGREDLYRYGTYCKIRQIVRSGNKNIRVMVEGLFRCAIEELTEGTEYLTVRIRPDEEKDFYPVDERMLPEAKEAMMQIVRELLGEFISFGPDFIADNVRKLLYIESLEELLMKVGTEVIQDYLTRQHILETTNLEERYNIIVRKLMRENQVIGIKREFQKQLKDQIDQNQKEYVLREQLKIIQSELGENSPGEDAAGYEKKLASLRIDKESKEKLAKEIARLRATPGGSQEGNVIRNYLETVFDIPWSKQSKDNQDIKKAARILDQEHYGLEKVKERIIEYLAVRILNPKGHGPILCLVGPPGTGKTSVARSVANALSKKYVRISLGGVRDEAEIRGHRKTYIGAMPGRIVEGLRQAGVCNPLMLLDEIDKVSSDYKGDTSSALLEVLDAEQNIRFRDHYVEIPVDLSQVLFIATANSVATIPGPLRDRMEIIEINSYTENEKFHIARDYLVAKQMRANGIDAGGIRITDKAIKKIIHHYTREAGVRNLERKIGDICRKTARRILEGRKSRMVVSENRLEEFLGKEKIRFEGANDKDEIGIVRGLAWTSVGGDTLQIEVNLTRGKGNLLLTGQMGEVMKESAKIALSAVRAREDAYTIPEEFFEKHDIHIHIPEGAVPKDGPSAGITMATAILSALTGIKVKASVAMTGEITLRGRVLPVGGLKEKILAAKLADIKEVIVPAKNLPDIEELSKEIKGGLQIHFVSALDEVLDIALCKEKK